MNKYQITRDGKMILKKKLEDTLNLVNTVYPCFNIIMFFLKNWKSVGCSEVVFQFISSCAYGTRMMFLSSREVRVK